MNIAISGTSGLIGAALADALRRQGHHVARLVRSKTAQAHDIHYDAETGEIDEAGLEGIDIVVHLAGESVGDGRWSAAKKRRIRDSRVHSTQLIASALARLKTPPSVFLCASAVGWYGDRGDELVDERSRPGPGFLADVCMQWEQATAPARSAGIRTICARMGVVLASHGGPLAKMLTPFKLGLGGAIGRGTQWLSWISLRDVVGAVQHLIFHSTMHGAVNLVSPEPVTNATFAAELARALRRPAMLPMPAFAARMAFGERADHLLLASTRAMPRRLAADGYTFADPTLAEALPSAIADRRAA